VLQEAQAWLTRLMAYTELLAQGVAGELSPPQRETADHLVTCAAHLRRLYHDVVDILGAVGQPRQLVLEPTIVSAIVEGVAAQAAAAANERGHHLEVDIAAGPTLVLCDGQSIQRVLATLLAAIMAQAPRGSRVRVAANDHAAPGYVQLTVRVLGAVAEGSPAGAVEASTVAPPAPGLEVARMLVTAHGGAFSFGAAPDGLAQGWITLPVIGFGELELAPVPTQRR
jgi:K+-sensing histidine kinase KdpD